MNWVTFATENGGLLKVRTNHIVAVYDELGSVKLSTVARDAHTLAKGMTVEEALQMIEEAEEP